MKTNLLCTFCCCLLMAHGWAADPELVHLAEVAHSATMAEEDPSAIIADLRAAGQLGLDAAIAAYDHQASSARLMGEDERRAWDAVIDAVAAQKDARHSGLFWHTDLDAAKAEAAATGRPILSLHLLGDLREDLTCANSRLFRSILYPDARVAETMRNNFVLHWWSTMQVPTITIDYGEGTKLVSTVTGNSIHYVLDADGRVVEALPGLFTPRRFVEALESATHLHRILERNDNSTRSTAFTNAHGTALARVRDEHRDSTGLELPAAPALAAWEERGMAAEMLTTSKMIMPSEAPAVEAIGFPAPDAGDDVDRDRWALLTAREGAELNLPTAVVDSHLFGRAERDAIVARLHQTVAADSARNRYQLHPTLRGWFIADGQPQDLEAFNKRVYAELFLTPHGDRWMGLDPASAYLALPDNGMVSPVIR